MHVESIVVAYPDPGSTPGASTIFMTTTIIDRAQGCLMGQLTGDSLGSLVEFESPEQILRKYPNGVRELADGGTWNTLAGQPTDDSEMALLLAKMLVKNLLINRLVHCVNICTG